MLKSRRKLLALLIPAVLSHMSPHARAGVTTDGTLGTAGALAGPNYAITANLGRQVGSNLFHSFSTFNIATGESAIFSGPNSVSNIISRVTGGSASSIDGLLRSTISGANLYFLNPAGITFGPNAALDVSGSFYASTANYLKLADGGRFDVSTPANSVLTAAAPAAFGFLGPTPAPITVNGSFLLVPEGQTLALLGGDITINNSGFLGTARSGAVHLVSVASAGEAKFSPGAFDVDSFTKMGAISISDFSRIDVSDCCGNVNGGGAIYIRGGRLVMDSATLTAATVEGNSGGIDISVTGGVSLDNRTRIDTSTTGGGRAGDIKIIAGGDVSLSSDSFIDASTFGSGRGGDINITAGGQFIGNSFNVSAYSFGSGDPGTVNVVASPPVTIVGAIETDGTLGSAEVISGPFYFIDQSLGMTVGTNLFHSFSVFNVGTGETAFFDSVGISNIIARVTGGNVSLIDGTLFAAANLYLVNPSGISFGPNASLSVSGSFFAGTANYLKLADGGRFDATVPANSVLTAGDPSAFGFIGPTPAPIMVDGSSLLVGEGQTLGLIGGDITINNGAFIATLSSGAVQLVSVASAGEAKFTSGPFDVGAFSALGTVSITRSSIDTSECCGLVTGGGAIFIRSGDFFLDGGILNSSTVTGDVRPIDIAVTRDITLSNGARIDASTYGIGGGGDISIVAGGSISMSAGSVVTARTFGAGNGGDVHISTGTLTVDGSAIRTDANDKGNGGSIRIEAGALWLTNGAEINSSGGFGSGKGGSTTITVSGAMAMDNSRITSEAFGDGDGGNINITASSLSLTNFSDINSSGAFGFGKGGSTVITVSGAMSMDNSLISSQAFGDGDAGSIQINAGSLRLANFSELNSSGAFSNSGAFGLGKGGNATIMVRGAMVLDQSTIDAQAFGSGDGGTIRITAGDLALGNSSQVIVGSGLFGARGGDIVFNVARKMAVDSSTISSIVQGDGRSGDIQISAGDIALSNTAIIDSSSQPGTFGSGGQIVVTTGAISLGSSSRVASQAFGDGNAGNIVINAASLSVHDAAQINTSSAGLGIGGEILISAGGPVLISGAGSGITSETSGSGNAGNISISSSALTVNGGAISASTTAAGAGGNINVTATESVTISSGGTIRAESTGSGGAGSITINAGSKLLLDGGSIRTSAQTADGGSITIFATDLVYLNDSTISSSTLGAGAHGGNILIDPTLVVLNHSSIIANAPNDLNAGNIDIIAGNILISPDSEVKATGTVAVTGQIVDVSGKLVTLGSTYLSAGGLLAERCAARLAGNASSFVVAGRGGMPVEPDSLLPSAMAAFDLPAIASAGERGGNPPLQLALFDLAGCTK